MYLTIHGYAELYSRLHVTIDGSIVLLNNVSVTKSVGAVDGILSDNICKSEKIFGYAFAAGKDANAIDGLLVATPKFLLYNICVF